MRKIFLHGSLGTQFGHEFALEVATAGEAIRALDANFEGFADALRAGDWHVVRGEVEGGMSLAVEEVMGLKLGRADLHIVPAIAGAKNDGMLKTIIGVALVGGAFALSGGALAAPIMASGALSAVTWGNVAMLGLGLALAGASQMLAPEQSDKEKKDQSYALQGPGGSYTQGSPVPLVYGEVITGAVTVSGGVDIEKIAVGS